MLVSRLRRIDLRYKWAVVDRTNGEIHDTYAYKKHAIHHACFGTWDNLMVKRLNFWEIIICQLKGI